MAVQDDFAHHSAALTKLAAAAADAVDAQIERLNAAADCGDAYKATLGVQKEAAILAALVARQQTDDQNVATRAVLDRLDDLGRRLETVARTVEESVDRFTVATEASTKQLARWTKVMAWATIILALVGGMQFAGPLVRFVRQLRWP